METFLISVIYTALISSFLLLFCQKIGVISLMQISRNKWISQLAMCRFCLSFWINVFVMLIILFLTAKIYIVYVPFFSTPITKFLISE